MQRNALVVLAFPQGTELVRATMPGTVHLVNRNLCVLLQCWLQDTSEPEEAGNLAHPQGGVRASTTAQPGICLFLLTSCVLEAVLGRPCLAGVLARQLCRSKSLQPLRAIGAVLSERTYYKRKRMAPRCPAPGEKACAGTGIPRVSPHSLQDRGRNITSFSIEACDSGLAVDCLCRREPL